MAHNLARIENQDAMFCVGKRESAWHNLGQRVENVCTWAEAIKLAKLDWTVTKRDIFARQPSTSAVFQIPDMQGIFRESDGQYLGTVGKTYEPIQNIEAFTFCDALLGAQNGSHYESAGALGNGERIWVLCRIPGADSRITGTDDVHQAYLMVATSHDGSMSYLSKLTKTRVVCQNTLNVALGSKDASAVVKIKHTKDARARLELAQKLIQGVTIDAHKLNERLNALARRQMTKDSMLSVINRLFPKNASADSSTKRDNIVTKVLELFESNDGNAIPQVRGSAYNLLNAVTEYTDHFRAARITAGRDGMSVERARAENALFGTGDKLKNDALVAVMEETETNPTHDFGDVTPVQNGGDWLKDMGISL